MTVRYRVHKRSPLDPFLELLNSFFSLTSHVSKPTLTHSSIHNQVSQVVSSLKISRLKFRTYFSSLRTRYIPWPIIFLDLITVKHSTKSIRVRSTSLCNFLQPPVTSSFLGPNILFSGPFSITQNYPLCQKVYFVILINCTCSIWRSNVPRVDGT
jgi:hypothetical protein